MEIQLKITFSGLCLFREIPNEVTVYLPNAEREVEYCGVTLSNHRAALLVDPHRLLPDNSFGQKQLVPLSVGDLAATIKSNGGGSLARPDRLAEMASFVETRPNSPQPQPERCIGYITLRGGEFTGKAQKTSEPAWTGRWQDRHGHEVELRWQDTWEGTVEVGTDRSVTFSRGVTGEHTLYARRDEEGDELHVYIVNVMPQELARWETLNEVVTSGQGLGKAEDFYWFCWMYEEDCGTNGGNITIPEQAAEAVGGMPYTCVMGGD